MSFFGNRPSSDNDTTLEELTAALKPFREQNLRQANDLYENLKAKQAATRDVISRYSLQLRKAQQYDYGQNPTMMDQDLPILEQGVVKLKEVKEILTQIIRLADLGVSIDIDAIKDLIDPNVDVRDQSAVFAEIKKLDGQLDGYIIESQNLIKRLSNSGRKIAGAFNPRMGVDTDKRQIPSPTDQALLEKSQQELAEIKRQEDEAALHSTLAYKAGGSVKPRLGVDMEERQTAPLTNQELLAKSQADFAEKKRIEAEGKLFDAMALEVEELVAKLDGYQRQINVYKDLISSQLSINKLGEIIKQLPSIKAATDLLAKRVGEINGETISSAKAVRTTSEANYQKLLLVQRKMNEHFPIMSDGRNKLDNINNDIKDLRGNASINLNAKLIQEFGEQAKAWIAKKLFVGIYIQQAQDTQTVENSRKDLIKQLSTAKERLQAIQVEQLIYEKYPALVGEDTSEKDRLRAIANLQKLIPLAEAKLEQVNQAIEARKNELAAVGKGEVAKAMDIAGKEARQSFFRRPSDNSEKPFASEQHRTVFMMKNRLAVLERNRESIVNDIEKNERYLGAPDKEDINAIRKRNLETQKTALEVKDAEIAALRLEIQEIEAQILAQQNIATATAGARETIQLESAVIGAQREALDNFDDAKTGMQKLGSIFARIDGKGARNDRWHEARQNNIHTEKVLTREQLLQRELLVTEAGELVEEAIGIMAQFNDLFSSNSSQRSLALAEFKAKTLSISRKLIGLCTKLDMKPDLFQQLLARIESRVAEQPQVAQYKEKFGKLLENPNRPQMLQDRQAEFNIGGSIYQISIGDLVKMAKYTKRESLSAKIAKALIDQGANEEAVAAAARQINKFADKFSAEKKHYRKEISPVGKSLAEFLFANNTQDIIRIFQAASDAKTLAEQIMNLLISEFGIKAAGLGADEVKAIVASLRGRYKVIIMNERREAKNMQAINLSKMLPAGQDMQRLIDVLPEAVVANGVQPMQAQRQPQPAALPEKVTGGFSFSILNLVPGATGGD